MNAFDVLRERGFVKDCSDERGLRAALERPITVYCGYDPTAPSLHVGHLIPTMALAHLQRLGHRPIALVGGGTALVGDPSGKTAARAVLTPEEIAANIEPIRAQLSRYFDFREGRALLLNNADWLLPLRYIEFLRDIGRHFNVNEMLHAETYRTRLASEAGLNFVEFNYMLVQAYDFLHLYREYDCILQVGGSDQWGNIVAGVSLIRKAEGGQAFALTFPLIQTASGAKMGKTERGAVWLDPRRTSPYEYYQFWINTEDPDVERFLAMFTFLPMEEVRALGRLQGAALREAKERLAYEATAITHGEAAAQEAREASRALFWGNGQAAAAHIPTTRIPATELAAGMPVVELFVRSGLCASKSEARRLIQQGGAYLNNQRVGLDRIITPRDLAEGALLLRKGHKEYHRVVPT
ncbi:MAG: tyrosine--tRNA ligase [Chloroflexi bacterium]|nr:tyrosine--tRNA ligase [Chloroflexota bacterium]